MDIQVVSLKSETTWPQTKNLPFKMTIFTEFIPRIPPHTNNLSLKSETTNLTHQFTIS